MSEGGTVNSNITLIDDEQKKHTSNLFTMILFFIIIIGQNIGVFYLIKRWISLSELTMLIFILYVLLKRVPFNRTQLSVYLLFNFLNIVNLLFAVNRKEALIAVLSLFFYSTFTLTFMAYVNHNHNYKDMLYAFLLVCYVLAIYGILQFILIQILGFKFEHIVYPFGALTVQKQPLTSLFFPPWRSNSLFYEPSIYGLTLVFGFAINETVKLWKVFFKGIVILGILVSLSLSTYLALLTVYIFSKLYNKSFTLTLKNINKTIIIIFIAIFFVLFLFDISDSLPYPLNRIEEIFIPGTSGYYRIVTPIYVTSYVLSNEFSGIGVGNIDFYLISPPPSITEYLRKGASYGRTIDSVPFVILINYGYLGFFILIFLLYTISKSMRNWFPTSVAFVFYLFSTGTFAYASFWIMLSLLFIIISFDRYQNSDTIAGVSKSK